MTVVVLAFSFAWSIGSHYTGACMGMPYVLGVRRWHSPCSFACLRGTIAR